MMVTPILMVWCHQNCASSIPSCGLFLAIHFSPACSIAPPRSTHHEPVFAYCLKLAMSIATDAFILKHVVSPVPPLHLPVASILYSPAQKWQPTWKHATS